MERSDKTEEEVRREESLLDQLVQLMEEQNATYSPPENSKAGGVYISWTSRTKVFFYHKVRFERGDITIYIPNIS